MARGRFGPTGVYVPAIGEVLLEANGEVRNVERWIQLKREGGRTTVILVGIGRVVDALDPFSVWHAGDVVPLRIAIRVEEGAAAGRVNLQRDRVAVC